MGMALKDSANVAGLFEVPIDVGHVIEKDGGAPRKRIAVELGVSLAEGCELDAVARLTPRVRHCRLLVVGPQVLVMAGRTFEPYRIVGPVAEQGRRPEGQGGAAIGRGWVGRLPGKLCERLARQAVRAEGMLSQLMAGQALPAFGAWLVRCEGRIDPSRRPAFEATVTDGAVGDLAVMNGKRSG